MAEEHSAATPQVFARGGHNELSIRPKRATSVTAKARYLVYLCFTPAGKYSGSPAGLSVTAGER